MSQADEVRSLTDIVKVVGSYVQLRKAGANYVGLCPFHREKTPSFAVHPTKQIFHCFGCGVGGDVFKFVMLIENVPFPEALHRLAEKAGIKIESRFQDATYDAAARDRNEFYKIHEAAALYFAGRLGGSAEGRAARAYLSDRGVSDAMIARFRLGYAPADGQGLTRRLMEEGFKPDDLEKSALIIKASEGGRYFDRFRRRIIYPIANESGRIVAFAGRALGDEQPKYLNSPETPIYTKSRILYNLHQAGVSIRREEFAVLVEGYMDCIALVAAGVENVVASCGTSLTESQVRLLGRYARRVVVNFDPDAAGIAATARSLELFQEESYEIRVLALPEGLDPDSFVHRKGAEEYRKRLQAAPSYTDYLIDRAAASHDLTTPEGKVAAANSLLPFLSHTPNPLLRSELAKRVAMRLHLDESLLIDQYQRAAQSGKPAAAAPAMDRSLLPAEKLMLTAMLDSPEAAAEWLGRLVGEGLHEGLASANVFFSLQSLYLESSSLDPEKLSELLGAEDYALVNKVRFESDATPDHAAVQSAYNALKRRKLERERERLQAAIERAEQQKDVKLWAELSDAKLKIMKDLLQLRQS